jgi:hypothetical protein
MPALPSTRPLLRSTSRKFTFDLTTLRVRPAEAKVCRTSATEDLVELTPIATDAWSLTATLPPYSVTTFVLELAP